VPLGHKTDQDGFRLGGALDWSSMKERVVSSMKERVVSRGGHGPRVVGRPG
jgi:hypothetical protein